MLFWLETKSWHLYAIFQFSNFLKNSKFLENFQKLTKRGTTGKILGFDEIQWAILHGTVWFCREHAAHDGRLCESPRVP